MSMAYEFGRGKEAKARVGAKQVPLLNDATYTEEEQKKIESQDVGIYFI